MLVGSLDGGWKERGERMSRREIKEKAECWTWSLPLDKEQEVRVGQTFFFQIRPFQFGHVRGGKAF